MQSLLLACFCLLLVPSLSFSFGLSPKCSNLVPLKFVDITAPRSPRQLALHTALHAVKYKLDGNEIRGPITPISNFLVTRMKDSLTTTMGGILLPDQSKTRPSEGIVLSAGPGRRHPHTGVLIPNACKEGDSVLYGKFDGTKINYNDEDCNLIRDDDVIMIYEGASMTMTNCRPAKDYILVEYNKPSTETSTGIAIAAAATKDLEPCSGTVVKLGEGRTTSEGKVSPCVFGVGDEVKFRDYAGQEVNIEGKEFVAVRMAEVLSVL
ncbi:hypothetical protein TrVE_jg3840 [Triparma verrucosa]|uniref:20 kDa chaperonin, chloroplastic n=1 Tax=Triparma verrucosa TaxID=1606542 RepID=A0A9W7C7E7_9STRA|nr:hypothetical protein TrVE_jg3840 [Triparma verrucosa]